MKVSAIEHKYFMRSSVVEGAINGIYESLR